MNREEMAVEIEKFFIEALPSHYLVRNTVDQVHIFTWEHEGGQTITGDIYCYKDADGLVTAVGRFARYVDGGVFNKALYLNPDGDTPTTKHHCIICGGRLVLDDDVHFEGNRKFSCITCKSEHFISPDDVLRLIIDPTGKESTFEDTAHWNENVRQMHQQGVNFLPYPAPKADKKEALVVIGGRGVGKTISAIQSIIDECDGVVDIKVEESNTHVALGEAQIIIKDLALLVHRLCKGASCAEQAMDYLRRKELLGANILRAEPAEFLDGKVSDEIEVLLDSVDSGRDIQHYVRLQISSLMNPCENGDALSLRCGVFDEVAAIVVANKLADALDGFEVE